MTSANDDSFRSIAGVAESAEPTAKSTPQAPMAPTQETTSNRARPPASTSDSAITTSMRHQALSGTRSLNASASPSRANSPQSSRDSSPARPLHRQQSSAPAGALPTSGLRSRKSSTDVSPSRGPGIARSSTTIPSAAAIERALSSASIPQLAPASTQDPSRVPRPLKSTPGTNSGDSTPHWPISPRIKSPPPTSETRSRSRTNSLRAQQAKKAEPASTTPSIVVQSSSPASVSRMPVKDEGGNSDPEEQPLSMKVLPRGASASGAAPKLETVQESSLPTTPEFASLDGESTPSSAHDSRYSDEERNDVTSSKVTEDLSARTTKPNDSGGESGNNRNDTKAKMQEQRSASAQRPSAIPSKPSFASLSAAKSRTEAPSRNMTVETETVPSIAQATIAAQDRSASGRGEGSLRLKASTETIRPKKEKPKPKRKAPSINSGTGRSPAHFSSHHLHPGRPEYGARSRTASSLGSPVSYRTSEDRRSVMAESPPSPEMLRPAIRPAPLLYSYSSTNASARKASSKADVFEQKVATAVDEANSSDSDATFIYESNPAEPQPQPHRSRQHSRTPSMASIVSFIDPRAAAREAHKNPGKKASMKFANPYNNPNIDPDGSERSDGTIRVGSGRVSGGSHHHHIGRHGQGRGALGHVLVDSDSSMAQPSRSRGPSSRHPSQPNSPRFQTFSIANGNGNANGNKKHGELSAYDIDTENAADDERTPLMQSVRSPRGQTPRRQRNSTTIRQIERRHRHSGGWCRRFAGCLVLSILVLVLIFSAVGLVFATTKPLSSVKVREILNVIASQEEIMLDLVVDAVNPNIIGVTVADMDVNIFAKSKHVGSDKWWREHGGQRHNQEDWHPIFDKSIEEASLRNGGVDEGTDPIDDPDDGETRTMLLGRIFHFDSPLNFDGSFFKRHSVDSLGEMRLSKPGNKTEAGGTERWEEVLQHPFELIVRGVFKYQLPLSTREHTVSVTATYFYDPDMEKKKLQASELRLKRDMSPTSVKISSSPLGRYARALAILDQ